MKKRAALRALFDREDVTNGIIFCNRKRDIGTLLESLQRHGYSAVSLHGDMDQHIRLKMLDEFKSGSAKYLIASDVAARGLDIPNVSHVFNFDVPTHAEDYVHRIGRTGAPVARALPICWHPARTTNMFRPLKSLSSRKLPAKN